MNVSGCNTLVNLNGSGNCVGTIAGEIDKDGSADGNYFVHETEAGIDGISYAGKAEGIESDVAQNVAQQSGHHIVCVPKTGADVQKRIASRCVENIDCKAADNCERDDCPFEGFRREDLSHPE